MSTGSYSDFLKALGQIESGQNYSFVSTPGYLGYYQFAEETLKAAGFYQGDSTAARDFVGGWTATAASFGVTSKASFLASPAAQDAAALAWFQKVDADLNSLGLDKYEGQTLNGVPITGSGLLAGTHLVGVWALKSYLESGGDSVPHDGNGEPVSDYVQRFAAYDTPFAFDHSVPLSLVGGAGADALHGFDGDDSLSGGAGANTLQGGLGADSIQGGSDADQVNGNQGADRIDGGSGGADTLLGGQGYDAVTAHAGSALLNGNRGWDTVTGGTGADTIHGGQGDDVLSGGGGGDQLLGDLGNDGLTGGGGGDVFHIGPGGGHDRAADFNAAEGDRVQVDGGAHYVASQAGADVVVTLDGGDQLTLSGVQLTALPSGWIV